MTKQEIFAAALPYALAVISAIGMALFAWLIQILKAHHINTSIIEAAGRAAGLAYVELVKSNKLGQTKSIAQAVETGVAYMAATVHDKMKQAGVTPAAVSQMVTGQLGTLLAADPTVGPGVAPTPPAVIVVKDAASVIAR